MKNGYLLYATTDYAITHNLTPFISMQNHYSLLYREEEREMFPTLKVVFSLKLRVHLTLTDFQDVRGRVDPLVASRARSAVSSIQR